MTPSTITALRQPLADGALPRCASERIELESDLRRALARREFSLHFQPIVAAGERRLTGIESLVRWQHPTLGLVPPSAFIPLAEQSGLIVDLGRFVLEEACAHMASWLRAGALSLDYISVNISGRQLADPGLPSEVAAVLRRTGLPADRLALEITESVLIGESASPTDVLARLERIGVRLFLDDFGTGYSSLNYLKRLPVQALKVDRSFINGITEDPADRHILRAIVAMAHGLGMDVVAEGIETVEQARCVRSLGCETLQGYLFSPPVPATEVVEVATAISAESCNAEAFADVPGTAAAEERARACSSCTGQRDDTESALALSEAARALGISTSTLRRWADAGRIRTLRTDGGHRRFPVTEIRRLRRDGSSVRAPVVRAVALPVTPLPALAALLRSAAGPIRDTSARSLYARPGVGWFAASDGEREVIDWARALADAAGSADFEDAIVATRMLLARAHYAGASLLERHTFLERYGDVAVRALQQRDAPHAELIAARRLFLRLRQMLLDEPLVTT